MKESIPASQAFDYINSYVKIYPKFSRLYVFDTPIQVLKAGLSRGEKLRESKASKSGNNPLALIESIKRTKTSISDITLCNDFELFVTFTFKKDRQNQDLCKRKMSKWLKNQRDRRGRFGYLIVPEFHKDGESLHFHALFKGYNGRLHKTNIRQRGRQIYNIKSYNLGFSTAVKIDDISKVSSYIKKYITKDMPKFHGKKRYWCSDGLIRPIIEYEPKTDINSPNKQKIYQERGLTIYHIDDSIKPPS